MTGDELIEQEFVAHLFAPLDGPSARHARRELELLWEACRTELGMTQPIDGTGLSTGLPADLAEGALAGLQDPAVDFQAVLRREHDVLNFSLVMAQPRRLRLGAATPPGWIEYDRWWRKLTAGGLSAFLGGATIFQAKGRGDVRGELPSRDGDADQWWTRPLAVNDLALWEVTANGARALRRLVVLGRPDEDERLSRFTWSAGDVALPPLGRYLMHAAKLRYQARVRGDGAQILELRDRATARLDRAAPGDKDLDWDLAEVAGTLQSLNWMQLSVEASVQNMTAVLAEPLPSDRSLATAVTQYLADDVYYLRTVQVRAVQLATVRTVPTTSALTPPEAEPVREDEGRAEYRVGFGIDVVKYSDRTTPGQFEVQRRLAGMVERVLAGVGVPLHDSDRQDAGDGMMVVLPARVQPHLALPKLLNGWRAQLVADNGEYPEDRIRLRLSVTVGRFSASAIGFTGATIIETGRLLDSDALRQAIKDHPDADLVALVSDRIYQDVVGEGYPGLVTDHFARVEVTAKTYDRPAWLWRGVPVAAAETVTAAQAPAGRNAEVFVIDGGDEAARGALFGLIRAIDLRPLEWDQHVARTGSAAPERGAVLRQAFADHNAAVVLFAPGASPDVLAGMAVGLQPDRTVLVRLGAAVLPPDLAGRDSVHLDGGSARGPHQLAERLRRLGYAVDTGGTDWLDLNRFKGF